MKIWENYVANSMNVFGKKKNIKIQNKNKIHLISIIFLNSIPMFHNRKKEQMAISKEKLLQECAEIMGAFFFLFFFQIFKIYCQSVSTLLVVINDFFLNKI
jgi:hypothetical protein